VPAAPRRTITGVNAIQPGPAGQRTIVLNGPAPVPPSSTADSTAYRFYWK